jgi:glycosyltransferase involved in cell wall biosynthesis
VSFIVLSEAFKKILNQSYKVPLDRIQVIPGGVNFEYFQTDFSQKEARNNLDWRPDRPTIFSMRRLASRMGLENLIEAIVEVKQRYPDIMLYIAGKGPLRSTLETLIKELELEENISLLGFVSDEQIPIMYRAADFSIVPTVSLEGFGLVVVESLASGTPVLGTPVGGIPEILTPFNSNLILEGSKPEQLARGIVEALSGQRQLPDSAACQSYIENNYNWPVIAQRLKAIYTEAAEGR